MKKLLLTLIVVLAYFSSAIAQGYLGANPNNYESHWPTFNDHVYTRQEPLVAAITIDGQVVTLNTENWSDLEVAAFVTTAEGQEECRGNMMWLTDEYVLEYDDPFLTIDGFPIYYNTPGGTVYFKMYDHANNIEYTECTVTYLGEPHVILTGEENVQGWNDLENPIILNFTTTEPQYESHWPDFDYTAFFSQVPLVAAIEIDGEIVTAGNHPDNWNALEIAFFVGEECRGAGAGVAFGSYDPAWNYLYNGYVEEYGDPFPIINGAPIYYVNAGELVTVKMYDHVNGIEYNECTITYLGEPHVILTGEENVQGWYDPENPIILDFTPQVCPRPGEVTVSDITTSGATVSWTENGTATAWQICLNNDETNLVDINEPYYSITGLNGGTQYTVKVRAICDSGVSAWSAVKTFSLAVPCPAPTLLNVTEITDHSALLTWTENGTATAWQICLNNDETTLVDINEPYYSITGLNGGTQYTVKVRAICDSGVSAWSAVKTFTTSFAQYESHWPDFDYTAFFSQVPLVAAIEIDGEIVTAGNHPDNWNALEIAFFVGEECRGAGVAFGSYDPAWNYLYNGYVEEYGDPFPIINGAPIYYVNAGELVTVKMYDHVNGIEYNECTVTYMGDLYEIRTGAYNDQGWGDPENPIILHFTTCLKPTELTASHVGFTSVDLNWTENGTATEWQISLNGNTNNLVTANSCPFTLTDLIPGTAYTAKVRANCGDSHSGWSNTVSFTTICPVTTIDTLVCTAELPIIWNGLEIFEEGGYTVTLTSANGCDSTVTMNLSTMHILLPYFEDFESYTESTTAATGIEPTCWELVRTDAPSMPNDKRPQVYYRSDFAHSGGYSLLLNYRCVYAMPALSEGTTLQNVKLDMYLRQANAAYQLEVGVWDDATNTFTPVALFNNTTTGVEPVSCNFSDYSGNGKRIAFRNVLGSGSYAYSYNYIDDITLTEMVDCSITLPYTENFDDFTTSTTTTTGVEPTCWELVRTDAPSMPEDKRPQVYYKSTFAHSGSYSLLMNYRCVYAMPELSEETDIPINRVKLDMYLRQANAAYQLEVGVWDDATNTFTPVALFNNTTTGVEPVTCNFSDYSGNGKRIAFRNVLANGYNYDYSYNYIDDITLTEMVDCSITLPYTENFDDFTTSTTTTTGVEPTCWELVRTDASSMPNDKRPQVYYKNTFAHSGSYSLLMNYRCVYAMPALSEETDIPINRVKLDMYLRQANAAYQLEVGVWDDATNTFTPVALFNNTTTGVESVTCNFSDYSGNGKRIAFRNVLANGYNYDYSYNYIDDITLTEMVDCSITLPFTENFDEFTESTTAATGIEPTCWELVQEDVDMPDNKKPQLYYRSDFAHSGNYSLLLNYRGVYAMPALSEDVPMNNVKLRMYLRQPKAAYQLEVGVWDGQVFELVQRINNSSTDVEFVECDFSNYTGNGRRIAFRNVLGGGANYAYSYNYLDDIILTACYPISLPYAENFESYTASTTAATSVEPDCWDLVHTDVPPMPNDKRPQLYYRSDFAHSGSYSLLLNYRGVYAMPALSEDVPMNNVKLRMYLRQPKAAYQLEVGVWDGQVFELVQRINNSSTDVEFVECDFSNYTGSGRRIAFRNVLGGGTNYAYSYNYIDDIVLDIRDGLSCPNAPTVTDIDGNVYNTVQIGGQCWMKENLRTTRYADGTAISAGGDSTNQTTPYYYDYSNQSLPMEIRGYLYNWPAAMVACPTGWHLPSDAEWTSMESTQTTMDLSGINWRGDHAGRLAGEGWIPSSVSGAPGNMGEDMHNASGFNAVPAGYCNGSSFGHAGLYAYFWSSTKNGTSNAYIRVLAPSSASVSRYSNTLDRGFSVRCLRDSIACADNVPPTFNGTLPDGHVCPSDDGTNIVPDYSNIDAYFSAHNKFYIPDFTTYFTNETVSDNLYPFSSLTIMQNPAAGTEITTTTDVTITLSDPCGNKSQYSVKVIPNQIEWWFEQWTICESPLPFEWNGHTFTQTDTTTVVLQDVWGCDSIVTLFLYVIETDTVELDSVVCETQLPFTWNGVTFTGAGTQTVVFANSWGCDSVVVMNLTIMAAPVMKIIPVTEYGLQPPYCPASGVIHLVAVSAVDSSFVSNLSYTWTSCYDVSPRGDTARLYVIPDSCSYNYNARVFITDTMYGCTAEASILIPVADQAPNYIGEEHFDTAYVESGCVMTVTDFTHYVTPSTIDNVCGWGFNRHIIWQEPPVGTVITEETPVCVYILTPCGEDTTKILGKFKNIPAANPVFHGEVTTNPTTYCTTNGNGKIYIAAEPGYTYYVFDANDNEILYPYQNLSAGDYTIIKENDATLCTSQTMVSVYYSSSSLTFTVTPIANTNCVAPFNGKLQFTKANVLFMVTDVTEGIIIYTGPSTTLTGLHAGQYSVFGTDTITGCTYTVTKNVTNNTPNIIIISTVTPNHASMGSLYDGVVSVHATCTALSSATFEFSFNGGGFGADTIWTSLAPGVYTIVAREIHTGCEDYIDVMVITETGGNSPVIDEKSCPAAPTVTDHEGNVYATVQIGNQCWMRDNLRTTTSPSTGTYLIPPAGTGSTHTGKQAFWYNNDSVTYAPMNYGLLYNWNAAVDTFNTAYGETSVNSNSSNAVSVTFSGHRRGICPAGWHLPSYAEWTAMTNYVGSQSEYTCGDNIAKALASTEGWNTSTNNCAVGNDQSVNNATGFSAFPSGYCWGSSFAFVGHFAEYWSSSQEDSSSDQAWYRYLFYPNAGVAWNYNSKIYGSSVRCLRDSITCADNLPPIFNGTLPDGHVCPSNGKYYVPDFTTLFTNETVSDNRYPFSSLTVTQNPVAGAEIGTTTDVTITLSDPCGNESVYYLQIIPMHNSETVMWCTVCESVLPYTWNGVTFTGAGTQTVVFANSWGCDSIVTMTLFVSHTSVTTLDTTVCYSELPLSWNGVTFTGAGMQTVTLTNAYGCDSIVTMNLNVSNCADGQPCLGTSTVTYDGYVYNTVKIGNQCWMKQNLRTTHYADGTSIPLGNETSTTTAYRYYPNNSSTNVSTYGYLYNWKAVMRNSSSSNSNPSSVQGICPIGWHVPSDAEWTQLTDYVSGKSQYVCGNTNTYIAKALAGTTKWNSNSSNTCDVGYSLTSNNATGFNALPAGSYYGNYFGFGDHAFFWSSTQNANSNAYFRYLLNTLSYVTRDYDAKSRAGSVRCLRDENNKSGESNEDPSTAIPDNTSLVMADIDASLNVKEFTDASINVTLYPNPTRDVVNVQCTMNNAQCSGIEIVDVYGKIITTVGTRFIASAQFPASAPTQINVSGLAAGMYFVRVTTDNGVVTRPFVKR